MRVKYENVQNQSADTRRWRNRSDRNGAVVATKCLKKEKHVELRWPLTVIRNTKPGHG